MRTVISGGRQGRMRTMVVGLVVGCALVAAASGLTACSAPGQASPPATAGSHRPVGGGIGGNPLLIATSEGPVQGLAVPGSPARSGGTRQFLGIPFAAPPVGGLRWQAPQPAPHRTAVFDATRTGSPCPQILPVVNVMVGSEDCLTMNVFAPAAVSTKLRPVMVWIYGGGFTGGSSTDDSPASFAAGNNTVAVSFNYRLGPLGFLALPSLAAESPDHATGDEGLLDQQAALRWVHQNIASFGGDPGNVTIFGESAGGISVCAQLVSPAAAGLFEKAITESGPCTLPALSVATAEAEGSTLAAKLGCGAVVGRLACMRSKPDKQVIEAMAPDPGFLFGHGAAWDPVADGVTLPTDAVQRLESGRFHRVPMIVGANRDEGRLFVALEDIAAGQILTDAQWASTVDAYFGPTLGPKVQLQYPLTAYPDAVAAFGQAVGDAVLACPAVESARLLARFVPVYEYEFEQTPNPFILPTPGIDLGAFHSSELPYVFDGPVASSGAIAFTPAQQKLATAVHDAWARFAATGNPSGDGLVWPRLNGAGSPYLALNTPITVHSGMLARPCAFWARSGFSLAGVVSK